MNQILIWSTFIFQGLVLIKKRCMISILQYVLMQYPVLHYFHFLGWGLHLPRNSLEKEVNQEEKLPSRLK